MIKLVPTITINLKSIESKLNQVEKCKEFGKGLELFDSLIAEFTTLVVVINESYTSLIKLHKAYNKQLSN